MRCSDNRQTSGLDKGGLKRRPYPHPAALRVRHFGGVARWFWKGARLEVCYVIEPGHQAPSSKFQVPKKFQIPNSKFQTVFFRGEAWNLELGISLELGTW